LKDLAEKLMPFRLLLVVVLFSGPASGQSTIEQPQPRPAYSGLDKNDYPGDDLLPALRKSFAFTGYWLNNPPGMSSNGWVGKRDILLARGFGFAVLFNGRLYADLKNAEAQGKDATALGRSDAADAIAAAHREGFPARAILFLDQEEGGHLLPQQSAYLFGWVDAVERSAYKPGVYCSGIAVGSAPTTAGEILQHYNQHPPALWVANDQCPPAPGCVIPAQLALPAASGTRDATIWQYAQSPRRPEFTASCAATYSNNSCYAPSLPQLPRTAIDLNAATSADPSQGR
jgi:hypothetical protein